MLIAHGVAAKDPAWLLGVDGESASPINAHVAGLLSRSDGVLCVHVCDAG